MNCSSSCNKSECGVFNDNGQCNASSNLHPKLGNLVGRFLGKKGKERIIKYGLVSDSLYDVIVEIRSRALAEKIAKTGVKTMAEIAADMDLKSRNNEGLFYGISDKIREKILGQQKDKEIGIKNLFKIYRHCFVSYNDLTEEGKAHFASIGLVDKYFLYDNGTAKTTLVFTGKGIFIFSLGNEKFINSLETKGYFKLIRVIKPLDLEVRKLLKEIKLNKLKVSKKASDKIIGFGKLGKNKKLVRPKKFTKPKTVLLSAKSFIGPSVYCYCGKCEGGAEECPIFDDSDD